MSLQPPNNPIEAATHPDPYPYYADLVAHRPLYWDETTGCWVASSAAVITAVLTNKLCRVRPPVEPVPTALLNSSAHACPGEMIAAIIARAGVEQLICAGVKVPHLAERVSYRSSANTRIPLFVGEKT
jgi:hypothetical protein